MKVCFKCGIEKSYDNFYKHKEMADGYLNKCKECARQDSLASRLKNIDRVRAYDRRRGSRQDAGYVKMYRLKYPNKYRAHSKVNNLIRYGRITKPDQCEECGSSFNIVGHHCDYNKPLEVLWLCQACHKQWHAKHGEALNGDATVTT